MELAVIRSRTLTGIQSVEVAVEVHVSGGLPRMSIVGLPETAVREARDRVRSAILHNNYEFPFGRTTVNLAPADLPKDGGRFDLAIALGILAATRQIRRNDLDRHEFIGELGLSGVLRSVRGVLPTARAVKHAQRTLVVPHGNADEAARIRDLTIIAASSLTAVCAHLNGTATIPNHLVQAVPEPAADTRDLAEVHGQHQARRALEIAAAGRHNLLLIGPPGSGKTMLAERLPGILPPMSDEQSLETAAIASVSQHGFNPECWDRRPLRAPHHTASAVALVGGGSYPRPGEISLAHNGVLFLDELPEFDRHVLEVLREPLESGRIHISRAANQAEFPADFQLICAMNPCPCGYLGDPGGRCRCNEEMVSRYRSRVSGPLLDRIDMHVDVPNVTAEVLQGYGARCSESSAQVRERVLAAVDRQLRRSGKPNARLGNREVERCARLSPAQRKMLQQAVDRLGLSARALHRVLKVARTIADLAGMDAIGDAHLAEAISYRRLDRRTTG